jgi:hypothetical protein
MVKGSELKVGDVLDIMGGPATITALRPYEGPLAHLWARGAQIATFAQYRTGITIDNAGSYTVLNRA